MTLDLNVLPHVVQPRCFLEQPFFNLLVCDGSEQARAQKQEKMLNFGNLVVYFSIQSHLISASNLLFLGFNNLTIDEMRFWLPCILRNVKCVRWS